MDRASLMVPGGPDRRKQIEDAKAMYQTVVRNAERTNTAVPPYDFLELIGKGAFGRVYKCKRQETGQLVAVKIVDIDEEDFRLDVSTKDESIKDFRKEVSILQQLKDSKARNVNMIHDAFDLHSQLWIISDYCTGGSVRTLMRANPLSKPGLEEQFIIPLARELAVAMKCVHDIGVIHRDIKCTNVYITEEGEIQLGDFGIVGIMDDGASKRATVIGTPWYMPKEMLEELGTGAPVPGGYGTEIDVWAYGCTIYEMATGQVPNQRVQPQNLSMQLEQQEPRLEGGDYSDELRDFVAFCLVNDPKERPSADQILAHPFIANSSKTHPTRNVVSLIERYAIWEYKGGVRASLWMAGGAEAPLATEETVLEDSEDVDDWNFSTSDSFKAGFAQRVSRMLDLDSAPYLEGPAGAGLPPIRTQNLDRDLTPLERIQRDHLDRSASRGEKSLNRVFNAFEAPYELHTPIDDKYQPPPLPTVSDLPLRNLSMPSEPRESVIDLDALANESDTNFEFEFDVKTLKAKGVAHRFMEDDQEEEEEPGYDYGNGSESDKRATKDWTFPGLTAAPAMAPKRVTMDWTFPSSDPSANESAIGNHEPPTSRPEGLAPGFRPTLKHTVTAPVGQMDFIHTFEQPVSGLSTSPNRESVGSMIDLDMADPILTFRRPSTASSTAGSTATDMTSGNPFDLEDDPDQNEIDRNRFSYHKQWHSEGDRGVERTSLRCMILHNRGTSLSSADSDLELMPNGDHFGPELCYDYHSRLSNTIRDQITLMGLDRDASAVDLNQWPDFGPGLHDDLAPALSRSHSALDVPTMLNGHSSRSSSRGRDAHMRNPSLEFPTLRMPSGDALLEDAAPQVVLGEFERLLNDMEHSFKVTANAIRMQTGAGVGLEENGQHNMNERTFDTSSSVTSGTEDEGEY